MGLAFSRIWERMFGKKEMRILMVGLDGHVLCGNQPVNLRKLNLDLTSTDIEFDLTHPDMQE